MLMCPFCACGQNMFSRMDSLLSNSTVKCRTEISFRGNSVSGLCLMRMLNDTIVGSIINEFGIKMLDFRYDRRKQKIWLYNVVKRLNKWYTKKVIKKDLIFFLCRLTGEYEATDGCRACKEISHDSIIVTNKRYNITYSFTLLN